MFIKNGATRHVLLIHRYAFKVARLTPLHVFWVTLRYLWRLVRKTDMKVGNLKQKNIPAIKRNLLGLAKNFFAQCRHHVFLGIKANRAEARYWFEKRNEECVPVVALWFGGLVLVQKRATPVTAERILVSRLCAYFENDPELNRPEQFGYCDSRVRIVDFAHWGDPSVLL